MGPAPGQKPQLHPTYATVVVGNGLWWVAWRRVVEWVGLSGGFSGGYGIVVDQDNVRVCGWFYRTGCGKLKNWKGFLKPNFELLPKWA
jgi:hypothetical protein